MVKHIRADEQSLVAALRRRAAAGALRRSGVILGIGDDSAIFRARRGEELLFTTDMLIEGTHFTRSTHSAADTGWTALARGLSDIAAMGGEPRFCLVSLAVAPWCGSKWVDGFFRGLLLLARRSGAALAGGDLSHAGQVACDVVVCGAAPEGAALRRSTARAGDSIYVSGLHGGSARGLELQRGRAWRRHLRPEPRLALGRFLRERLAASAAMDLSDGISLDLRRLCLASGLSAEIEPPPRFPGATLEQALHGGEDYELLFTVPNPARVPATFEGIPLTRIGTMRKGRAGAVKLNGAPLAPLGYDHFRL